MNKKLLTMITTGAIAISNMNFAFAEGFIATPDDSEFPIYVDGGMIPEASIPKGEEPLDIPNGGIPKGEEPIFEKIPNAHISEDEDTEPPIKEEERLKIEKVIKELEAEDVDDYDYDYDIDKDERVAKKVTRKLNGMSQSLEEDDEGEPGDDILDDVISGEEYEEIDEADDSMDEEPMEDEPIIDEAEMERLEREEHEKELAEKEQAEKEEADDKEEWEDDDWIMDEIEKDAEKYDKENEEEDVIGGIDDDYYDVGEEPEVKDEDPAENIKDDDIAKAEKDKVEKTSINKEATSNANNKDTNANDNTAETLEYSVPSQDETTNNKDKKVDETELAKKLNSEKGESNPKTGDMGILGSIAVALAGLGGLVFVRKKSQ